MKQDMINYINQQIIDKAKSIPFLIKDQAPNNETDLFNSTGLVIWSGGSDTTIYNDKLVNYSFRAYHDKLHLETGLDFSVESEIKLGMIQASKETSDLMRELVYCEVVLQAKHFQETGCFVSNQVEFTVNYLKSKGLI